MPCFSVLSLFVPNMIFAEGLVALECLKNILRDRLPNLIWRYYN